MLVLAMKHGHDGGIAALDDDRLVFSLEAEKDSFERHLHLTPTSFIAALELLGDAPDVVALGGWLKDRLLGSTHIGTPYQGLDWLTRETRMLGKPATMFNSSHERSHIAMALAMAPERAPLSAVLCWEGSLGRFYLVDERWRVTKSIQVMTAPGGRYAYIFALADPLFPKRSSLPRIGDAGKLMALAAFGDPAAVSPDVAETVDQVLALPRPYAVPKASFEDSPIYDAGVESEACKGAAALITERIFDAFAAVAREQIPRDIPLFISGGCGLNCDWNHKWRETGQFSSVFVPPCTDDSGSALGTALDARLALTGEPFTLDWDVYAGLEFVRDCEPDAALWERRPLDEEALAAALAEGRVVAWVQGRWEIGPRALGNRSLLADPSDPSMKDKLNRIKQREDYRPIAPCCRLEDAGMVFNEDFADPYMLYFRTVRSGAIPAVTHVDRSARAQTVTRGSNVALYDLLTAVNRRTGVGVLCNTSLNYKGRGFINRMTDLAHYCEQRSVGDFVVGDEWFVRRRP